MLGPHPRPLSHAVGEGGWGEDEAVLLKLSKPCNSTLSSSPHPRPLSHAVGEGSWGETV